MSTSLDIPSSSGIVIVDNTSNNENILQVQQREHLPIHHIQQSQQRTTELSDNNINEEYTKVIDSQNNTIQTGVINFTSDLLSNNQVLKFVSDDNTTVLDSTSDELQNYRIVNNQSSKVHVISNLPFGSNKQHGSQQAINLVSNGKNITGGVNFVNAYITKAALPGKILNLPVKGGNTNVNQIQQQIVNKSGNQLIQKVSVPRNVQFVARTQNSGGSGNIIMSRTSGSGTSVIHTKGQQILVPQSNIKATISGNVLKNKAINNSPQVQSVKIFQGAQKQGSTSNGSSVGGIKTVVAQHQKTGNVKPHSNTVIGQNKFIKQFSSPNSNNMNSTITQTFSVQPIQQIAQSKSSHLAHPNNVVYTTCNNNINTINNNNGKVQTVEYQRTGNINNVLIQGKMIGKGNKYVVQNSNSTHIVIPASTAVSGNLMTVPGPGGNVQQLKLSNSLPNVFNSSNNSGTIKYVNAQGNVIQPPTKVRAIFQQTTPIISTNITNPQSQLHNETMHTSPRGILSPSSVNHQSQINQIPGNTIEDMIANGTIMSEEEISARILQSLSQQKVVYANNRQFHHTITTNSNNNNNNSTVNNNSSLNNTSPKLYSSPSNANQQPKMYITSNHESSPNSNSIMIVNRENIEYKPERYFKVSSCDLTTTTTFIDNIPLTSTRGDNVVHGQRQGGDDREELIGEEIRPGPLIMSDGKIYLLQAITLDHTYAAVLPPEQQKKTQTYVENTPSLTSSNIQSAGLNFNFKSSNNDDDANSAISTGSRNGVNRLDNDLGEETETAPEAEGEDDSVTRCICDLTHDDGYMICCDKCSAWQHVDCMGIDRQNIPEEYKCELCQPRPVDKQRARNLQVLKRKEQQNLLLLNAQQQQQLIPIELNTNLPVQPIDRSNPLNKNLLTNLTKKHKTNTIKRKGELASTFAQQKRERKLSVRANGKRREPKKVSKRKAKLNSEPPVDKSSNLRTWIENYEQAITNHYSPELRARLHAMGKQNQFTKDIIPMHMRNISNIDHRCTTVPHAGGKILISTVDLAIHVPVVEIRGKYMLSSQFRQQQAISSTPGNVRNHQYNRKPGPFLFFYRLSNDGPEVCIDTRTYGNEARFVRRSCRPNAEVLHSIEKGTIHLYIVSLTNIIGGSEITIKHEPHDLAAIARGTVLAPTSTVCACGCPKDCIFAGVTQNHLNSVSQKPLKKINGNLLDDTGIPYRRSKSLGGRGRSTSSSGDSNAGMLSPNNSVPSLSLLQALPVITPLPIPIVLPPVPIIEPNKILPVVQSLPTPIPLHTSTPTALPVEKLPVPLPSRPQTLNIMPIDPPVPIAVTKSITPILNNIPLLSPKILSPIDKIMTPISVTTPLNNMQPMMSPTQIIPNKISSPQKSNHEICMKKTPNKVRHISFSEELTTASTEHNANVLVAEDSTVKHELQKQNSKEPKEKNNSPKLSREERKMQAIMKAFEKMEKNQERKQQLKQNKSTIKRRNSSPSSPKSHKEDDHEKSYHPRKKKRKGSKSYQHLSHPKKIRRRSRANSGDSDLLSSEESTSLLSPPLPPGPRSYTSDDIKSPRSDGQREYEHNRDSRDNASSAAGLLLALSHSHSDSQESTSTTTTSMLSHDMKSPTHSNNQENAINSNQDTPLLDHLENRLISHTDHVLIDRQESLMMSEQDSSLINVTTPPLVSSACLLIEAAVAPLEHTSSTVSIDNDLKFTQKAKTKKTIMNEWLNQTDNTIQNDDDMNYNNPSKANFENLMQAAATMCDNYNNPNIDTNHSPIGSPNNSHATMSYIQDEPENLSMVAKKVEEFIFQNDIKISPDEDDIKWSHPNNVTYPQVSESNSLTFVTSPGALLAGGSGSAAKKRWLRQAISEECNDELPSPPNGFTTPLKKRRIARQCSELTPEEISHSLQYNTVFSVETAPIKNSPSSSPNNECKLECQFSEFNAIKHEFNAIKHEFNAIKHEFPENAKEFKLEELDNQNLLMVAEKLEPKVDIDPITDQEDEIDIVNSPPPGEKMVVEDNLVKIEPEDENEKDEKIDVVEDSSNPNIIDYEENVFELQRESEEVMIDILVEAEIENIENSAQTSAVKVESEEQFCNSTDSEENNEPIILVNHEEDIKTLSQLKSENVECSPKDAIDSSHSENLKTTEKVSEGETCDLNQDVQNCDLNQDVQNCDLNQDVQNCDLNQDVENCDLNQTENFFDETHNITVNNQQPIKLQDDIETNIEDGASHSQVIDIEKVDTDKYVMDDAENEESGNIESDIEKPEIEEIINEQISAVMSDSKKSEMEIEMEVNIPDTSILNLDLEYVKLNDVKIEEDQLSNFSSSDDEVPKDRNIDVETMIKRSPFCFTNEESLIEKKYHVLKEEPCLNIQNKVVEDVMTLQTEEPHELKNDAEIENIQTVQIKSSPNDTSIPHDMECNDNDEILDIQKRLHSFHTENILILKSRNKKTKPIVSSFNNMKNSERTRVTSPTSPHRQTPPPVYKMKKPVQLNFDLSIQDDTQTVNVKLKEKPDLCEESFPITTVLSNRCSLKVDKIEERKEVLKQHKCDTEIKIGNTLETTPKEERQTRWDKLEESRYTIGVGINDTRHRVEEKIAQSNSASNSNSSYIVTNNLVSTYATTSKLPTTTLTSGYGTASVLPMTSTMNPKPPPTIHIPPNTPASHLQYYNAFYNKYSTTPTTPDETKKQYPTFTLLSDYLDTTNKTSFRSSIDSFAGSSSSLTSSTSTLLDLPQTPQPQPIYYSSMNSTTSSSLISSFLSKSYSSDQISSSIIRDPPKVLTRTQSADPRLNPNLNIPEPPPPPKRKLSINEYRKRKQQSESSNGEKATSKSSTYSDSSFNGFLKLDTAMDHKECLRQIEDKDKEVLFSPAPTELELQQEILSERLKNFKSLHALSLKKSDEANSLAFMTPSLKERDCIETTNSTYESLTRANRLSIGSNSSSSSSLSSLNSDINPNSPPLPPPPPDSPPPPPPPKR